MTTTLVRSARLLDASCSNGSVVDLLVRHGRIDEIGPSLSADGAAVVEAAGLTVLPTLTDCHIHASTTNELWAHARLGVGRLRYAGVDLETVRDVRRRCDTGDAPPLVIDNCGPMLDLAPVAYPNWSIAFHSAESARAAAESVVASAEATALIVTQRASSEIIALLADVAHAAGLPLVGQVWAADGAEAATSGIDQLDNTSRVIVSRAVERESLLHYEGVGDRLSKWAKAWTDLDWAATDAIIDSMVAYGVSYCPTLVQHEFQAGLSTERYEFDERWQDWYDESDRASYRAFLAYVENSWTNETRADMQAALPNRMEWLRRFRDRGGRIKTGTDMQFGALALHRELELLVETGLSPAEALRASWWAADADERGPGEAWLRPGDVASFVLVGGVPERDVTAVSRPRQVFLQGVSVPVQ